MGSSITLAKIGTHLGREDADFQRQNLADLLHRQSLNFPGAQPVSFARRHLDELRHTDYFMCEKTDGVRCLLYLTHIFIEGEEVEAQFLIDRKNDYYYIPRDTLHLPRPDDIASFHTGTLLDGELVRQEFPNGQGRLAYLIFDCLAIDKNNVTNLPFDKRLARVNEWIFKPLKDLAKRYPQDVAEQPFQVEMKAMEFSYGMEIMFKDKIPKLPHGNDGLIFTCKDTPYVSGTDEHILKWKPPHENTIDFRLLLGDFPMDQDEDGPFEDWDAKPEMELHVNHGGSKGYQYWDSLNVEEAEWDAIKEMNQTIDGRIIEAYRDPQKGWRPKIEKDGTPRFRDDKKDANHISVVESVIVSIKDAVTEEDLIDAATGIRDAYKRRQKARDERAELKRRQSTVKQEDTGPTYED